MELGLSGHLFGGTRATTTTAPTTTRYSVCVDEDDHDHDEEGGLGNGVVSAFPFFTCWLVLLVFFVSLFSSYLRSCSSPSISAFLLPIRSVGVQGDSRSYASVVAVTAESDPVAASDWEPFFADGAGDTKTIVADCESSYLCLYWNIINIFIFFLVILILSSSLSSSPASFTQGLHLCTPLLISLLTHSFFPLTPDKRSE